MVIEEKFSCQSGSNQIFQLKKSMRLVIGDQSLAIKSQKITIQKYATSVANAMPVTPIHLIKSKFKITFRASDADLLSLNSYYFEMRLQSLHIP